MTQVDTPGGHPGPPPSLIFDSHSDSADVLWQRLHERAHLGEWMRFIVHLKNGSTQVGRLVHFDQMTLTLGGEGNLLEIWLNDVAHVIVVPR